jgi:N-acetylmuramoyl-L-alanine amidase
MNRRSLLAGSLILAAPSVWAAPVKKPVPKPKLIALDPGHGGRDPGALGYRGTQEKGVVIAVARDLARELQAGGKYRVMLTRASDTYVPLRERVARAQDAKADLFLSIHADSHPDADVRGASVYTLSEEASDREAAALAARENRDDSAVASSSSMVARTLVAMAQRGTVNDSCKFADTVVGTFGKSGILLLPRSHRKAGFAVLTSPDIPAALVELGYLSNPRDEKLLTVRQHQMALARALRASIEGHLAPRAARA